MIQLRLSKLLRYLMVLGCAAVLSACGNRNDETQTDAEDAGPSYGMVSIANPHAAQAAMRILEEGGTAVDAAIAAQAVLSLTEPQSSGLGGGAFLLYFEAETGRVRAFDGREMAPSYVRPEHFLGEDGRPRPFYEVLPGGLSVGVPGVVAMLSMVYEEEGALPWSALFGDAIALSEAGFEISPRLAGFLDYAPWTSQMPDTVAYFYDDEGQPFPAGTLLQNPAYAETLRQLAAEGPAVFYEGAIAAEIVAAVQNAPNNPAPMTINDLAGYRPVERDAICRPYRAYIVCGMPPPTSGGVTVQMILTMLERFDLSAMDPYAPETVHVIAEAERLAYADRAMYLADSDYVAVPLQGLLSANYLFARSALIDPERSMGVAEAGNPWPDQIRPRAPDLSPDVPGTSHMSIIDRFGNAVSMTTTVESIFGSHLMAGGFFLNNQLTDFSFEVQRDGYPVANAPAPGKRPRSSMAPTIVLNGEGELFALVGSAGGARIPAYVAQQIVALTDWGMSPEEAAAMPHYMNQNGRTELEEGTAVAELESALEALGHEVVVRRHTSGSHIIRVHDGDMTGGADPRREGVVLPE